MKKRILMMLLLTFNIAFIAQVSAQFFDNSVHFYIESGDDLTSQTKVKVICFADDKKLHNETRTKYEISQNLQKSSYYYTASKAKSWPYHQGTYQNSMSTSSRDVYGGKVYETVGNTVWYPGAPLFVSQYTGYSHYYGFTKDKSSYIEWKEDDDGNVTRKQYYIEVSKEDLMPKAVNRDFLYE